MKQKYSFLILSLACSLLVISLQAQNLLEVEGNANITGRLLLGDDTADNILVGQNTGLSMTTGSANVIVGNEAGISNETGARNVFIGQFAGTANTTGASNTFLGFLAGNDNTAATNNTYVGAFAGSVNTEGTQNAFLGSTAGLVNTTGFQNTFLGTSAGQTNTSGKQNTYVGFRAGTSLGSAPDSLVQAIAIGYRAQVKCDNCAVIGGLGNDAVNLGIATDVPTARLDVNGTARIRNLPSGNGLSVVADSLGNLMLAPDVSQANAQQIESLKASLQDKEAELQALKHRLQEKDRQTEALEGRLDKLELMLAQVLADADDAPIQAATLTDAKLFQNQPNPFNNQTSIRYFIPKSTQHAELQISDFNGRIIKLIPIETRGEGKTLLQTDDLSAGSFTYSLVLDGILLETKRMVLTR
jgi:hypothetical protein